MYLLNGSAVALGVDEMSSSEICEQGLPCDPCAARRGTADENVSWLDVPVNDSEAMKMHEGGRHASEALLECRDREAEFSAG
jgi:hypothetical protein